MKCFTSIIAAAAVAVSFVPSALAHGFVKEVSVSGGSTYKGVMTGRGGSAANSGVVRKINTAEPNHLRDTTAIPCGPGANTRYATQFVAAKPGNTISLVWDGGSGHSRWPHNLGPMVNYIAQCKTAGCKDNAADLVFFKIDQQGLKPNQNSNSNGGSWYQEDVMKGAAAKVKLPSKLPAGDYILRHEIIALHEGNNPKMGPEFYPSCVNVRIAGAAGKFAPSGTGVKFPAGYKTDAIGNKELTKTIFRNWKGNVAKYNFPGPAPANFGVAAQVKAADVGDKATTDDKTDSATTTTGDDGDDDCTDDGDEDDTTANAGAVTVTVTKTVTVAAKETGKTKRSRHNVNRLPSSHFSE